MIAAIQEAESCPSRKRKKAKRRPPPHENVRNVTFHNRPVRKTWTSIIRLALYRSNPGIFSIRLVQSHRSLARNRIDTVDILPPSSHLARPPICIRFIPHPLAFVPARRPRTSLLSYRRLFSTSLTEWKDGWSGPSIKNPTSLLVKDCSPHVAYKTSPPYPREVFQTLPSSCLGIGTELESLLHGYVSVIR